MKRLARIVPILFVSLVISMNTGVAAGAEREADTAKPKSKAAGAVAVPAATKAQVPTMGDKLSRQGLPEPAKRTGQSSGVPTLGKKGTNDGALKPADPLQEKAQKALGGGERADALKKRVDQISDVNRQGTTGQGIGQEATGVGQKGVAGTLGIGSGPGQKMGEIESRFPKIGGSGGVDHSPGAVTIDEVTSQVSTGQQKDTKEKSAGESAASGSSGRGDKASSSKDHSVRIEEIEATVSTGEGNSTKGSGEGDDADRGASARAKVRDAAAERRSASYQITHGSGEKPGATGAPANRVPVKKGGKASPVTRGGGDADSLSDSRDVKLNVPKGGSGTYNPAAEGIGVDVQPK